MSTEEGGVYDVEGRFLTHLLLDRRNILFMEIPPLSSVDEDQFRKLTAQESYSKQGQIRKILLVEKMIRERQERKLQDLAGKHRAFGLRDEEAEARARSEMQEITITSLPLGDGRYNLIVGKGSGRDAGYTVFIPAHVDTVEGYKDMLELNTDSYDPDRWKGLGVWDMGAAVLNNIALAVDARIPQGMQVYFAFVVDEELDSDGAMAIIEKWSEWSREPLKNIFSA